MTKQNQTPATAKAASNIIEEIRPIDPAYNPHARYGRCNGRGVYYIKAGYLGVEGWHWSDTGLLVKNAVEQQPTPETFQTPQPDKATSRPLTWSEQLNEVAKGSLSIKQRSDLFCALDKIESERAALVAVADAAKELWAELIITKSGCAADKQYCAAMVTLASIKGGGK